MKNRGSAYIAALTAVGLISAPVLFWTATEPNAARGACADPSGCAAIWFLDPPAMNCAGPCPDASACVNQTQGLPGGNEAHSCYCTGQIVACNLKVICDGDGDWVDGYCMNAFSCPGTAPTCSGPI